MIVDAKYLHHYYLDVTFEDKTSRVINLEGFFRNTTHPLIRKFAPLKRFKQFRIDPEINTLCWGDNECDIDPFDVYEGKYDAVMDYV